MREEIKKILQNRINTQRRVIKLSAEESVIIHPTFLRYIDVLKDHKYDKIKFMITSEKTLTFDQINSFHKKNNLFIVKDKKGVEHSVLSANVLGEYKKIKIDQDDNLIKSISIEHNPSMNIVIQSLYLNQKLKNVLEFSKTVIDEYELINSKTISSGKLTTKLKEKFNDSNNQNKIIEEYLLILKESQMEISSAKDNTSAIKLSSIQYLIDKNQNKFNLNNKS